MNDLTQKRIEQALESESRPTRITAQFTERTTSTNADALDWLRARAFDGSELKSAEWRVFVSETQHAGRGRLGKSWLSAPGEALTFTLAIPVLPLRFLPYIGMEGAVSVIYTLRGDMPGISIKWPNDVQMNGRKVCGILPEAAWEEEVLLGVALGFGINVRSRFSDTSLETTATSIEAETNITVDRAALLASVVNGVESFRRLTASRAHPLYRKYLNTLGQQVRIVQGDTVVEGQAEDVDEGGALLVRGNDGVLRRAIAGDLFMI